MAFAALTPAAMMIGGGMAAGQGTLSVLGAQAQNRAMASAADRQRQTTMAARQQTAQQAAIERRRLRSRAHTMQHRLRVAAGEAGTGMGGSFGALSRQADLDLQTNLGTIQMNEANRQQAIVAEYENRIGQLAANTQNPILAGLMGGVQGMSTGLSIGATAFPADAASAASQVVGGGGMAAADAARSGLGPMRFT